LGNNLYFSQDDPELPLFSNYAFETLPGGTNAMLNVYGITLEDIAISSYQGYLLNGNKNGYEIPELSKFIDGQGLEGDLIFQNGIQTPGFFKLPICTDMYNTLVTIAFDNQGSNGPNWPCG